ncbi:uncharacterized protein ACIBXB_003304 isoform 1-T1 [Morphnus guianensis]
MAQGPGTAHGAAFALSVAQGCWGKSAVFPTVALVAFPVTQALLMTCQGLEVAGKTVMTCVGPLARCRRALRLEKWACCLWRSCSRCGQGGNPFYKHPLAEALSLSSSLHSSVQILQKRALLCPGWMHPAVLHKPSRSEVTEPQ